MENQPTESTAAGGDRISGLPDEILHLVLRALNSSQEAAQTTALSRRWVSVWRSYPVVEFDQGHLGRSRSEKYNAAMAARDLEDFGNATIKRFSRDSRLRIVTLKLSLQIGSAAVRFPVVEQLLDLAFERKVKEVAIRGNRCRPIQFLSNTSDLYLIPLMMNKDVGVGGLPLHLNSLRTLHLERVKFENEGILANLIRSSPLLETLKVGTISKLEKLLVSDAAKLRTLEIGNCYYWKEIEIAAPQLQTLRISGLNAVSKFELLAPRLSVLRIENRRHYYDHSRIEDFAGAISKLESLRFLTLKGFTQSKRLMLSSPKLERFELWAPAGLEEIDLDVKSGNLQKFSLHYNPRLSPSFLGRCEMNSSVAPNGCKVYFSVDYITQEWFVGLKDFIDRFTHFQTVNISLCTGRARVSFNIGEVINPAKVTFNKEEVDYTVHPTNIEHLKIVQRLLSETDEQAFRDGLFWACSPKFLTIIHEPHRSHKGLLTYFLNLASHSPLKHSAEKDGRKCNSWENRLKDVRIESKETEMETANQLLARVCFRLTWC